MFEIARELDQHLQAVRQILKQPLENAFGPGELTGPQRAVLQALVQSPGVSLKELSKSIGLAHSTVSGIIDRLERRGLARRIAGAPDRRVTRITVTDSVLEVVRDNTMILKDSPLVAALSRTSSDEQAAVLEAVRRLRGLLESVARPEQG